MCIVKYYIRDIHPSVMSVCISVYVRKAKTLYPVLQNLCKLRSLKFGIVKVCTEKKS